MTPANALSPTQQTGQNLAPLLPLTRLRDGSFRPSSEIADALKDLFKTKNNQDRQAWNSIYSVGQLIDQFCQGNQILTRNPYNGVYSVVPVGNQDANKPRAINLMQWFRQNLIEKWEESNPDINIRPGRDEDKCAIAAKGAAVIWKQYSKRFYSSWFSQQQCILGHSYGTYVDELRFDDKAHSLSIIEDIFETKKVEMGEGYGFCPDCQVAGPAKQFEPLVEAQGGMVPAKCLDCGSESASMEPPASAEMPSVSGQKENKKGDLVLRHRPLPGLKWDASKRLEQSSFLIARTLTTKGEVVNLIGNIEIPGSNQDDDYGLKVMRESGHVGQPIFGRNSTFENIAEELKKNEITWDEMWLSASDCAEINLTGDEETVSGGTIPKGRLSDLFPDGMCVTGLNGMSVVLGIYSERHKDHFVSGTWFQRAMSGTGRGIGDSIEVQKRFNSLDAQQANYWASIGTPGVFYDPEAIPSGRIKYLGSPRVNIPVNLKHLPETRGIADVAHQFQPGSVPAGMVQYTQEFLNLAFQKTTMVTDFASGQPGITGNNDTATAANIDQSNSDAINGPIFAIKGEVRKRECEMTVEQYRQHFPMPRFFPMSGRYGKQQGMMVYGADLQNDLEYEVAKGSHLPKGPYARRQNLMGMFQVTDGAVGYVQLKQADPKLADQLRQGFDVDVDEDEVNDVTELCQKRLAQMQAAEKVGVSESQALLEAISPPISEYEPNLAKKSVWFQEWLDTDAGQDASPGMRAAVELLAQGQFAGQVQQDSVMAGAQGAVQTAGAAPGALAQQQMEAANQQPPEEPQIDPNQLVSAAADAHSQDAQSQEAERQRAHEQGSIQTQHKNAMELEKLKGTNQRKVAAMKPKPKAGAKK